MFSSKNGPPCLRIVYTASVDKSSGLGPGSPFFAGFLVGDLRLDSFCRNRQESLPVSTMWQGWVRRSSKAVVILAAPNNEGHSAKLRLVVIATLVRS
jgi:hypothetical protein